MRPVNFASVFLVATCCSAVLSAGIIREKSGKDLLKFSMTSQSKISAKRRFRRDSKEDHPNVFNVNKEEGVCKDPTESIVRRLQWSKVSVRETVSRSLTLRVDLICFIYTEVSLWFHV